MPSVYLFGVFGDADILTFCSGDLRLSTVLESLVEGRGEGDATGGGRGGVLSGTTGTMDFYKCKEKREGGYVVSVGQ